MSLTSPYKKEWHNRIKVAVLHFSYKCLVISLIIHEIAIMDHIFLLMHPNKWFFSQIKTYLISFPMVYLTKNYNQVWLQTLYTPKLMMSGEGAGRGEEIGESLLSPSDICTTCLRCLWKKEPLKYVFIGRSCEYRTQEWNIFWCQYTNLNMSTTNSWSWSFIRSKRAPYYIP